MISWREAISHLVLLFYCVFGTDLINIYLFNDELYGIWLGLLMVVVFVSAYPIFGWKRNSPWARLGRWSLTKWALFGLGFGIVTAVVDIVSGAVVRHFSV